MTALLILAPLTPLALIPLLGPVRLGEHAIRLAPLAMLPALALALSHPPAPGEGLVIEWLGLGARLGLDGLGRAFLCIAALLWAALAWYARGWLAGDPDRGPFFGFLLAAAAGGLGVCVAQDTATYYGCYTLMGLAAYGLILQRGRPAARRAAAVYLAFVVLAGLALFELMVMAAPYAGLDLPTAPQAVARTAARGLALVLALIAFGVHAGLPGLHGVLTLACRSAALPGAAALMSAAMLCGLLGWLRFVPAGVAALPAWGALVMALGVAGALLGAVYGLTQREGRALLAYLGVSQGGLVLAGIGAGLAEPESWAALRPVLALHAAAFVTALAALYMGLGLALRSGAGAPVTAGLLFAVAALCGVPFSGGGFARAHAAAVLASSPAPWAQALSLSWSLAAVTATALAVRFLLLLRPRRTHVASHPSAGLAGPWFLILAVLLMIPAAWLLGIVQRPGGSTALSAGALWTQAWPPALGALIALVLQARGWLLPALPPGDAVAPLARAARRARLLLRSRALRARVQGLRPVLPTLAGLRPLVPDAEARLAAWRVAGPAMLVLLVLFGVLFATA